MFVYRQSRWQLTNPHGSVRKPRWLQPGRDSVDVTLRRSRPQDTQQTHHQSRCKGRWDSQVFTYIHTNLNSYIHTHIHINIHTYTYILPYTYIIQTYKHIHINVLTLTYKLTQQSRRERVAIKLTHSRSSEVANVSLFTSINITTVKYNNPHLICSLK